MASKIKLLTLGFAAAALLGSAQAAVVILDFEALGSAANSAGTPVGDTYLASNGVAFSAGAIAQHNGLANNNVSPPPLRSGNHGFVSNAFNGSTGFFNFTITFDAGRAYTDISLDWAAKADFIANAVDTAGTSKSLTLLGRNWSGWAMLNLADIFGDHRPIDHVLFKGSRDSPFAIDNLRLETTSGSTVPEPAGLGLLAVALAGAGLASRRSRQA